MLGLVKQVLTHYSRMNSRTNSRTHADPADPHTDPRGPSQRQIRLGVSPDTMARGHHGKEVPPVHSRKPLGRWDEESDDDMPLC